MAAKKKSKLGNAFQAIESEKPARVDLEDEEVVQIFQEMHNEAETAFRPIKDVCDMASDAYNNAFDFSDKSPEQSASFLPIYKSAIRTAKSIVGRSLLESPEYFSVEGLTSESKELEDDIQDTLERVADQSNFKEAVATAAFAGFIQNLAVLKIFPVGMAEEDEIVSDKQTVKIVTAPVSPVNDFRLDPTGRGLYLLHRTELDFSDYEELVGETENAPYTRASLEHAMAGFSSQEEEFRKTRDQGMQDAPKPSWRKTVELWEVWTRALCRKNGSAAARNVLFTVLNKKHLARKVTPYLYGHGLPPFVWSPVADKPFSVYGENYGEPVLAILDPIIDLLNSLVDAARNVATKGFEVSIDQIKNPADLARGIYGGKVVKAITPPIPGLLSIRPFDCGEFSPDAYAFLQYLVQQFHNGIGVTELLSGIPGMGEKTATEITQKTRAAMGNLNEVTRLLDQHLVGPSLNQIYRLLLEWNPEVFGDRVAHQTSRTKLKFKFHISGISGALKREGELQELMFIVKTLMATPAASRINWNAVATELWKKKGYDPKRFMASETARPPEVGAGATPPERDALDAMNSMATLQPPQMTPQ